MTRESGSVFATLRLMVQNLWLDFRHALRVLARAPRHTAIAVGILGLGIGANTAMFSAINHVLLRPLPFPDSDRLVRLRDEAAGADGRLHAFNMSSRTVLAMRAGAGVFDAIVAMSGESMTLFGGEFPERVSVVLQTDGFERTLGVRPVAGRAFTADEERLGLASQVALISHAMWQSHFGGAPAAIGSTVRLDDRRFTIVGVMPPQYAFPYDAQFWVPFALDPADQSRDFAVFGRPRPGVTPRQLRDAVDQVAARVRRDYATTLPTYGVQVKAIRDSLIGAGDAPLRALAEVVAFLLLVTCVNVATLLLARSVTRRREFAVRAALGASLGHHVRQLLAEGLALASLGCVAGLLLAAWLAPLTAALVPPVLRGQLGLTTPRTDWRVAAFAIAASVVSALVAGLVPAFGSWRGDPGAALSDGGRTASGGPGARGTLGALIIAETALTLVLLAGAGLVIRNFVRLERLPLGFDAEGLLTLQVTPSGYATGPARAELARRMTEAVGRAPRVTKAAITTVNPLGGATWGAPVVAEVAAAREPNAASNVNHRLITPGLFAAMGIPLLRGRAFTDDDRAGRQPVAIVSERMARRFWPGDDALGKRVRLARPDAPWLTIVGVVGNVSDAHEPDVPLETWYLPFDQNAASFAAESVYLMVRGDGDALDLLPAVRRAIAGVDKTLAPYAPAVMDRYYTESIGRERVSAAFMLAFGAFGLALAALGVYGVMAFSVAQRTAEFGIRMALGAGVGEIVPLVLRWSVVLVGVGVAAGMAVAVGLNRVLASQLTEVGPIDGPTLAGAALLILAAGGVACLVPALRAARLDPVDALKSAL